MKEMCSVFPRARWMQSLPPPRIKWSNSITAVYPVRFTLGRDL